jgi:hypothetical protein
MSVARGVGLALIGLALARGAAADLALDAYRAVGIRPTDVLSGTVVSSRVRPGEAKQVVLLATYFTGTKDESHGVNVRLEVLARDGGSWTRLLSRDYGKENGGSVGRGELELVDLDGDGVNEIVVGYDDARAPLVRQRRGEVLVWEGSGFRVAWADLLEYDATRAIRDVPAERRDRYVRQLDLASTRRTKGASLVFRKKMLAVAGETLAEPRVLEEAFPLRGSGS